MGIKYLFVLIAESHLGNTNPDMFFLHVIEILFISEVLRAFWVF